MKRVKIMLSAILAIAIVAGAFAFKAKKLGGFCLYTLTTVQGQSNVFTCPKQPATYLVTPTIDGGITVRSIFTTVTVCADAPNFTATSKCTITLTTTVE